MHMKTGVRRAAPLIAAVGLAAASIAGDVEHRTINGSGNNTTNPDWGATHTRLGRVAPPEYGNGYSTLGGVDRLNPRTISNNVVAQDTMLDSGIFIPDPRGLTDYVWAWGQFLAHDTDLTPDDLGGVAFIQIPPGDPWFDPDGEGIYVMPFRRSDFHPSTGSGPNNPREQINVLSTWIDASTVYGSDESRANWLRTFSGGKLKVENLPTGVFPPLNDGSQMMTFSGNDIGYHVAGDDRANETSTLLSMHTLFVREHNRLADEIAAANPTWTDEQIFQRARRIVGAEIQAITFNQFLPTLLGKGAIPPYSGYNPSADPTILNEFSTAAFRVGHTMISTDVLRLDALGQPIPEGNLHIFQTFFRPERVTEEGGIEPILRGLAASQQQQIDSRVVDDLRNFLLNSPGAGEPAALDLAAVNIQRGRDHGLADYNTVRQAFGLPARTSVSEISSDPQIRAGLEASYEDVNDIDLWVGLLAEDHYPGSSVGETLRAMWIDQFTRLRDGDRFWFQNDPELADLQAWLESLTLRDVVVANTPIEPGELQENVFQIPCPPDLDGNGAVDGVDLATLLAQWGSRESGASADLTDDGVVDAGDLSSLLAGWGACYE